MKYPAHIYAKALAEVIVAAEGAGEKEQDAIVARLVAFVRKNGDEAHLRKIVEEAARFVRGKSGVRKVMMETARPLGAQQKKKLAAFIKTGDVVVEKINPELVAGVKMTPFVHVATGADFASPFANAGDQGLGYINSDVTIYLHRLPVTNWIGFEVVNHHATDGVAIGECWLYDEQGPIGTSTVAALAQRKPMTNPPPP